MTVSTRFRPESKQVFSQYAGDLARELNIPLQAAQELLARIYGYANLHELQQLLKDKGAPGPFAEEDPAIDAARAERLRKLFGSLFSDFPVEASLSLFETFGLFLPAEAHRAKIEALAGLFGQGMSEEGDVSFEAMRLAIIAPVLHPHGEALPKKIIGTALPECAKFLKRWEKTASFRGLKRDGFSFKAIDTVYQPEKSQSSAQLIIFLDLFYSGPDNGPSVLQRKLSDPKLQATLSQVLDIFAEVSALKDLRIGPWTLSYRVTHDGRAVDYEKGTPKSIPGSSTIQPEQFAVNEAWAAFLFLDRPLRLVEGQYWSLGILDVMSGYILAETMVPVAGEGQDKAIAMILAKCLQKSKQRKPRVIFVQKGTIAERCAHQNSLKGVTIDQREESFLLPAIGGAKATVGGRLSQLPI